MNESPHFIQIILDDALPHGKLGLPKEFIRKYGDCLSSPITLKVPNGATWQVELLNRDDKVLFEKGWQEFAKYHRLKHGHLLMFKYEQPCHFYVLIFDKSATEIEYPSRMISAADQNLGGGSKEPDPDENEDNSSVEILDWPSPKMKGGEELLSPPSVKRMRTVPTNETAENAVSSSLLGNVRNNDSPSGDVSIGNTFFRGNFSKRMHKKEASQALKAADKHMSEYPSFKSVVFANLKRNAITMQAPYSFSRQHFLKKVNDLTLRVADRSWPVRLLVSYRDGRNVFGTGMTVFARENSLKQGDVCVFELIESGILNVCIFRRDDYDASACSSDKEFGNLDKRMHKQYSFAEATKSSSTTPSLALEAATRYVSEFPSFKCTIVLDRYKKFSVFIPFSFGRKIKQKVVTLRVGDGSWSVKFLKYRWNPGQFGAGLHAFARENSLKERDVCVFELIENGVLNVCIFRYDDYDTSPRSSEEEFENLDEIMHKQDTFLEATKPLSPTPSRALEAATKYISVYPSFMKVVPVKCYNRVYIPSTFSHMYLKYKSVRLQVGHGSWSVRLVKCCGHSAQIGGGWRAFARENSLKGGDVCVFELIEHGVLNVCIFRHDTFESTCI